MSKLRKKENFLLVIFRVVVGLVFIFSSFVKGVDPLGTVYRVEDYLDAYGWFFLTDFAFFLAFVLIVVEFLLGVSMLFRLRFKLGSLGVLLIMIIFTIITYFDATLELVPDCGCFGDAVKLTNWETFYKNIVLIIMAIVIFAMRNQAPQETPKWFQNSLLSIIVIGFMGFMYYNISHLPIMDYRDWKVGKDMKTVGEENLKVYLNYKNKESGEIKEYLSPNYPWNDSLWMANWEFVGQRFDDSSVIKKHMLIIEDSLGNDYTKDLVENPGTQILLVIVDFNKCDDEGLQKALQISKDLPEDESMAIITGESFDDAAHFLQENNIDLDIYFSDDIELKAMIRSNPGILLLKNGIVEKKLHHNDFSEIRE
jgi:uncharacterized membrane protein YphA (DoxX/SURF4 family)